MDVRKTLFIVLLVLNCSIIYSQDAPVGYSALFSFNSELSQFTPISGSSGLFSGDFRLKQFTPVSNSSHLFALNLQPVNFTPLYAESALFLFETELSQFTPVAGNSTLFSFNTVPGIASTGSSGNFMFNNKYGINGIISDQGSGLPIQNAFVTSLGVTSLPTEEDGYFRVFLKKGYGYPLNAFSPMHVSQSFSDINITDEEPMVEFDIELESVPIEPALSDVMDGVNLPVSVVQEGGTLYRYYQVMNLYNDMPLVHTQVAIESGNTSIAYLTDEYGVVKIAIDSDQIGDGSPGAEATFSITEVNYEPVEEPVSFNAIVETRQYSKYLRTYTNTKLGVPHVDIEGGNGLFTSMNSFSESNLPDNLNITRQRRGGAGISAGVGANLSVQMGEIINGAGAGAGLGVIISGITEDNYSFPYVEYDSWDAAAQYILLASSSYNMLDKAMIRLLTVCQDIFSNQSTLDEALISDRKAIDIKGQASAFANIGHSILPEVNLNAGANIGVEGRVLFDVQKDNLEDSRIWGIEQSGKLHGSAGGGLIFDFPENPDWVNELPDLYNVYNQEETLGFRFEIIRNATNKTITSFRLYLMRRSVTNHEGFETERVYEFKGSDIVALLTALSNTIIYNLEAAEYQDSSYHIDNVSFRDLVSQIFSLLSDFQFEGDWDADISYYILKTSIDENISNIPFKLSIGLDFLFELSLNFGKEEGFEEGRRQIVEYGKWYKGKHYPLISFFDEIPHIDHTFQEKIEEVANSMSTFVAGIVGIVNFITNLIGKEVHYIGDTGSFVEIPASSFPVGLDTLSVVSWSWYGDRPSKRIEDVEDEKRNIYIRNKYLAEKSYGMEFGIGGFYQFEPYGEYFNDTAYLTLAYSPEEVVDFDEQTLRIYSEDKVNKRWVYVGGVVDTVAKTVTAPITQLSMYTLAPSTPYGDFGLNAHPESIEADSVSTTTIISDTIFYNNLTPVADGELFTVVTAFGEIITPDANPEMDGIQIATENHKLQFELRSSHISTLTTVTATSVKGSAHGSVEVYFFDTIPPLAPILVSATPSNNSASLEWMPNTEADLAGYKIYYDTDTIPPFNGIHTVYGQPSPIIIGSETSWNVKGLFNDTIYYFAVSAYDISGNESLLSNFLQVTVGPCSVMTPDGLFADEITSVSAKLHWTNHGTAEQWDIIYGQYGFNPQNEGVLIEGVLNKPYNLYELEQSTHYEFYVRAVCEDVESEWSEPGSFVTNHIITSSSGNNGHVLPEGEIEIAHEGSIEFEINPDFGYHISNVIVNGESIGAVESYLFENVHESQSIYAEFDINVYTINALPNNPAWGNVSGAGDYEHGQAVILEAMPEPGYIFVHWLEGEEEISNESPIEFTALDNRNLTAFFDPGTNTNVFWENDIIIYPNPFSNTITVVNAQEIKSILFANILGQTLLEEKPEGSEVITISTENLPKGIYLVTLIDENGYRHVRKMVKD